MPYNRDLQTEEPTSVCADCGHIAYHHRPECGYITYGFGDYKDERCRCRRFKERLTEEHLGWLCWGTLLTHTAKLAIAAIILLVAWGLFGSGLSWGAKTIAAPRMPHTATAVVSGESAPVTWILPSRPGFDPDTLIVTPTPSTTTTTTSLPPQPVSGDAGPPAVQAFIAPTPPVAVRVWQPADECSRLLRPVSAAAMRWCPTVARYLYEGQRLGAWVWEAGDLTRLVRIVDCESRGREWVMNRSSRASGLFQHLPRYWSERSAKAAALFGFDNPTILMGYDNAAVGVWLFKTGGARHWPTCGRR